MKKKSLLFLIELCVIVALVGCMPTHEQQLQQRINNHANTMYLVFWGNGFEDIGLPQSLAATRNEINEAYFERHNKAIFITNTLVALNLDEYTITKFTKLMHSGFTIYFYEQNIGIVNAIAKKFGIAPMDISGNSFLFRLIFMDGTPISFVEFAHIKHPLSYKLILTMVLDRMIS